MSDKKYRDLELLDSATKQAKKDIDEMCYVLEKGQIRAEKFFAEIEEIKRSKPFFRSL